jgi:DNA-directed RNA polymerase subunit E'/Rpb7
LFLLAFSVLIFKVLVEEIVEGIVNALTETA